jgi:hypothetical protein
MGLNISYYMWIIIFWDESNECGVEGCHNFTKISRGLHQPSKINFDEVIATKKKING